MDAESLDVVANKLTVKAVVETGHAKACGDFFSQTIRNTQKKKEIILLDVVKATSRPGPDFHNELHFPSLLPMGPNQHRQ